MSGAELLSLFSIALCLVLLAIFMMRGMNIYVAAFICAIVVCVIGQMPLYSSLKETMLTGFTNFFKNNYLMFLSGALMGKVYEMTNGAKAVARFFIKSFGPGVAMLVIPFVQGFVLCYGGVSGFVVGFTTFPIALEVFRQGDYPRRFLPALIAWGSSTYSNILPGTPQLTNTITCNGLGVNLMAGTVVGYIVAIYMYVMGAVLLVWMIRRAKARGEHFVAKDVDHFDDDPAEALPNPIIAIIPLVVTVLTINLGLLPTEGGVITGAALGLLLMFRYVKTGPNEKTAGSALREIGNGCINAVTSITNTCIVVGLGAILSSTIGFDAIVRMLSSESFALPPLVGACIAVNLLAGCSGSASGGLGIIVPILGPLYTARGVNPAHLARLMGIASTAMDSLPHNGYMITVIYGICHEDHKSSYLPLAVLTVLMPLTANVLCIVLFTLFPMLP